MRRSRASEGYDAEVPVSHGSACQAIGDVNGVISEVPSPDPEPFEAASPVSKTWSLGEEGMPHLRQPPRGRFAAWKWKAEFKELLRLALPTMVLTCSEQAMVVTGLIFMGHRDPSELAAAALANTYCSLRWQFLLGSTMALDTLGSQAVGCDDHAALVTWCSSAFFVTSGLVVPIMVAQFFGGHIAKYVFGQGDDIASLMALYCRMLIPGMWPLMWSILLTKYLQVQNAVLWPTVIMVTSFALNIGLTSLLMHTFGFKGAPVATTVSRGIRFLLLALAVFCYETWQVRDTQAPLNFCTSMAVVRSLRPAPHANRHLKVMVEEHITRNAHSVMWGQGQDGHGEVGGAAASSKNPYAFAPDVYLEMSETWLQRLRLRWRERRSWHAKEVWEYTKKQAKLGTAPAVLRQYCALAISGGCMLAFEASSFDIMTVFAGHLGTVPVASHAIMQTIIGLSFMACPFALSVAASIRVGNLLGARKPTTAQRSASIAIAMSVTFSTCVGVLIYTLREYIGLIFTRDPAIIQVIASIVPMAALMQISDGIQGPAGGVLRGCGFQRSLMFYNFTSFWVCGCMVGYLLCFVAKLGLRGLWWGIVTGDFTAAVLNLVTVLFVDWEAEDVNAHARVHDQAAALQ